MAWGKNQILMPHLLVIQDVAILGSCLSLSISSRLLPSARLSKATHTVTLTFPPHVNTELQSLLQVFHSGCWASLGGCGVRGGDNFIMVTRGR